MSEPNEPSNKELEEQAALQRDQTAWEQRKYDLDHAAPRTGADHAELAIYRESHRVEGEKLRARAKEFERQYGHSQFED